MCSLLANCLRTDSFDVIMSAVLRDRIMMWRRRPHSDASGTRFGRKAQLSNL